MEDYEQALVPLQLEFSQANQALLFANTLGVLGVRGATEEVTVARHDAEAKLEILNQARAAQGLEPLVIPYLPTPNGAKLPPTDYTPAPVKIEPVTRARHLRVDEGPKRRSVRKR